MQLTFHFAEKTNKRPGYTAMWTALLFTLYWGLRQSTYSRIKEFPSRLSILEKTLRNLSIQSLAVKKGGV